MTTGSPNATVDRVDFVLGASDAVQLSALDGEEGWEVLLKVIQKTSPHFRNLFRESFEEVFRGVWKDMGDMPLACSSLMSRCDLAPSR